MNSKKWIEALRSGKYKQGRHHLKNKGEFCCLGVFCDISGCSWDEHPTGSEGAIYRDCSDDCEVPSELWKKLDPNHKLSQHKYLRLNDMLGLSFLEIADIIEDDFNKEYGDESTNLSL